MSKVIVITGAGVGLGRTLARRFAADGDQVVLLGRTASKVEAAASEIGERAMALGCDVGQPDSVRAAFKAIADRHGRIDVLINNAAIFEPYKLVDATDEQLLNAVNTNLLGPMLCVRSALPLMQSGALIINVTSEGVDIRLPCLIPYQSTKAGVESLSRNLADELRPDGIRVTAIRCGQMFEEGKTWDVDMNAAIAFHQAAMERGINLRERPISQFTSLEAIFRMVIDLPPDVHSEFITVGGRHPS